MNYLEAMMRLIWIILLILLLLPPVQALETESWALVAEGFSFVTAIGQAPGDSDRLFIADLGGTIHVVETGQLLPEPFLDLREIITTETYGQGLLGLTFHPDYVHNGYFLSPTPQREIRRF